MTATKSALFVFQRSRRESEKTKYQFTSDDIIIAEDPLSRSPPGFLYVEFAVVKTINGKIVIVDPAKLRQTITLGGRDGIAGYDVIEDQDEANESPHNISAILQHQPKTRSKGKSSDIFKIGFAVVLTLVVSFLVALAVVYVVRR
jgi:hypothetical protein